MLAYYGERISPHMTDTPEGFLICHDVPIGRTGEMEYMARELQLDGDPERIVRVTREEDEIFSQAALASFEGKPVTDGHPPERVAPENCSAYAKGHLQNVRRGGDLILADLHITDPGLISEVKNGVKREVSCGYTCTYEPFGDGYRQKDIRGNHVAVVPKGRAGRHVAIHDSAGETAGKGLRHMKKETKLAVLRAFGLAAQDAEPEELDQITQDTATLLDAEPVQTPEAEPETADQLPAPVEGGGVEAKLDKLLELLGGLLAQKREPDRDTAPEESIDAALTELGGGPQGSAEVVEPGKEPDKPAADAAVRILKNARPVIAAMKDPEEKRKVTDALLSSIRTEAGDAGARLLTATAAAARQSAQDGAPDNRIRAQQSAYDARNPHKSKKEAF